MWKLKIAEGVDGPHLYSTNNYVGRQTWEFDANAGTPEERTQVEEARQCFYKSRFQVKPSADLIWRMQEITGVFMKNCMLHYAAYRNIYPLWALAEYRKRVPLP